MAKAASKAKKLNLKQEAESPDTSAARLKALAKETKELARLVAANTSCPRTLLQSLSLHADNAVRKRVASNPQTPAKVAASLGSQFPNQLLDNSAFDAYLLEYPDLLKRIGARTLRSLVKREMCPASFLEYAANFDDEETQLSLLTNAATPKTVVEGLQKGEHAKVREAANWHVSIHPEAPEYWKKSFNSSVGKSLKTEEQTTPDSTINALGYVIANSLVAEGLFSTPIDEETDILQFVAGWEVYSPIIGTLQIP